MVSSVDSSAKAATSTAETAARRLKGRKKVKVEVEGVLLISYTPGSTLKKMIQEVEDVACRGKLTGKIKVAERVGRTIYSILTYDMDDNWDLPLAGVKVDQLLLAELARVDATHPIGEELNRAEQKSM